jgi:Na+-transporting NADH:ubiquinone oxidoreductase subunit A
LYVLDESGGETAVRCRGGYNIPVAGAPSPDVVTLPVPERLYVPLMTPRFSFDELRVEEGARVTRGDILAVDSSSYSIPLLAPLSGTVRLSEREGHVVLEDLETPGDHGDPGDLQGEGSRERAESPESQDDPVVQGNGISAARLLELGVWQFFADARSRTPVDPAESPDILVVAALSLEPFVVGGEALLSDETDGLARGVARLHSLFPACAVCVAVPDSPEPLAVRVREAARKCGCARVLRVPMRYPFDDPALLDRLAGLATEPHLRIWTLSLQGLLALDRAATHSSPCTERVFSLAGPSVIDPMHLRAYAGYPIDAILEGRLGRGPWRVVDGGLLKGSTLDRGPKASDEGCEVPDERRVPGGVEGLDSECEGLTVLPEHDSRTFLGFARPGFMHRSYSRSFAGTYRPELSLHFDDALAGELRPCISCGQCAEVCPALIMPNVLHKALYARDLERAIDLRVDLCIECGLCSYVCPSKIDLRFQFITAKAEIKADMEAAAALEAEA